MFVFSVPDQRSTHNDQGRMIVEGVGKGWERDTAPEETVSFNSPHMTEGVSAREVTCSQGDREGAARTGERLEDGSQPWRSNEGATVVWETLEERL